MKVLGLDIGISSVGWGIVDTTSEEIIDAGVRLFEEASRNANEDRRNYRSARRVKRRRVHRLERFRQLLEEYQFPTSGIGLVDPYVARRDGIYDVISKERLAAGLYHIVKRRGIALDAPEKVEDSLSELSTKEQLARNKRKLVNRYICEFQLEKMKDSNEKIRNHENRFRTADYLIEAKAILNEQKKHHEEVTEQFIEETLNLIETRREYFEGPGSKKSPTPYGPYFLDGKGNLVEMSMINKMRGKCTFFPDELRIPRMSYTADLFNLLSGDLNKIQIDGEHLTYADKLYLVNHFIKKGKNITLSAILKYKEKSADAVVTGCRIDMKKDKPVFTEFKGYKIIYHVVKENNLPTQLLDDIDMLDELVNVLTAEKSYARRKEQMEEILLGYDSETRLKIIDAFIENTEFVGYHALSKKAIELILKELWETNKNQIELFSEMKLDEKRLRKIMNSKNIKFDDDAILSTVARRAHREAVKIVNAARRKYGEFDSIIVETAREKNSDEQRLNYSRFQREIDKFEKRIAKLLAVKELKELRLNAKQHLALKLWDSQDGKCIYSGRSISLHEIVADTTQFEIDHVLPISLSFDDSQANKVLCYQEENQKKGQLTPFQYFSSGKTLRTFNQFKVEVLNLYKSKKITSKKKDYLLELRDLKNNDELQKQFINRNLVDTQYAMRSFSNTLRTHFKVNNINTTVLAIRGSFTAAFRRRARLNKDRDAGYAHHATDALIVAAIGRSPVMNVFQTFDMDEQGVVFYRETGEILPEKQFFEHKYLMFLRNLKAFEPHYKYSHKVDRKGNRMITKQTIYSIRDKDNEQYFMGKTGNIYELDKTSITSLLNRIKKYPDHFLVKQHNPEVFDKIVKIIEEYPKSENPFRSYYEEHGYILKDGKVPIKVLRYFDTKLGVHLDITHKYPNANNGVALKNIKSVRIDLYRNAEGKYKYVGVPYAWFKKAGNELILDMERYELEKSQKYKKIDDTYEFQLSLYKNDLFTFEKSGNKFERIFRGDSMPRSNNIEVDYIDCKKEKQSDGFFTVTTLSNIIKYNVDILGNKHKIEKEKFKMTLQI